MRVLPFALPWLLLGLLTACSKPPPEAYLHGTVQERPAAENSVGTNSAGEPCSQTAVDKGASDVFCGTWQQPSAHVRAGGPASAGDLPALAANSPWRVAVDGRMQCEPPVSTTILGDQPALLLQCTSRFGGWPSVAMVANVRGSVWYGDAVLPAAAVMERAIGVQSGVLQPGAPAPRSGADGLLARRLAARAFGSGDVAAFEELMTAGTRANLADDMGSSEAAFRAALAVQQKALGNGDANRATPLMSLAVQLSNEGRYADAEALFAEAARLAPTAADSLAPARLLHYRGLHVKNRNELTEALALFSEAEAAYAQWVPPAALQAKPKARVTLTRFARPGDTVMPEVTPSVDLVTDPRAQVALIGLIEARRNRALVLRDLNRVAESSAVIRSADELATANGLTRPMLSARLYRTGGVTAATADESGAALADLVRSSGGFERALPGSKTLADTLLLRAAELQRQGHSDGAVAVCRQASQSLIALKTGTTANLVAPCLDAYAAEAERAGAARQTLLADMFAMMQLAQGGITSEQIALATARLRENARNPKVAEAIRRWQDSQEQLTELYRQQDELRAAQQQGRTPFGVDAADLEKRIAAGQTVLADADTALQAAAPNYGQLVQQVVTAADVQSALHPDEAFAAISLSDQNGWVLLLRPGDISVAKVAGGTPRMAELVHRIRSSIELTANGVPRFDVTSARELYDATLGGVAAPMTATKSLIVAPAGPLLALPFGVLLTGPADANDLADAPWLLRKVAISHVPAAANFVGLRRIAGGSRAGQPWFGFGDPIPVTLAQAQRSFPAATCGESARLLAGLPRLPLAGRELDAARQILGGRTTDELTGPAFTASAVIKARLRDYRVLHFSTHALLPAELRCEDEPAIVTSAPAGAVDASRALLNATDVVGLDLDAEEIILSACNTGGPGESTGGESLSGLARAFFYAGARSMLVTHWSVNDQAAAYLVADTLRRWREAPADGMARAVQGAELGMLAAAGHAMPADLAHPFFWAPFAVIGEGGASGGTPAADGAARSHVAER